MTEDQIRYVTECIKDNDIHRFYIWKPWLHVRKQVLELDRCECQDCKLKGIYTRATTVHHENYVKRHPELALEIWYTWRGQRKRNLVSLCHDCHERRHGYRKAKQEVPLTEERW